MTPREVIARAIFIGDYDEDERWDECPDLHHVYFKMADAVIDALASMEVTEADEQVGWTALYLHPPPRREPLTDSAIHNLAAQCVKGGKSVEWALRELERAHGIGGES